MNEDLKTVSESQMSQALTTISNAEMQLTAIEPDEMVACQVSIIDWCRNRIANLQAESKELETAAEEALKNGWRSDLLSRQAKLTARRVEFYQRMLVALEHGYVIVPNFPVRVFAVRSDRDKPLKLATTSEYSLGAPSKEQIAQGLPAGEGEYKNPFPEVWQVDLSSEQPAGKKLFEFYANAWKEMEFPITMSKPTIMQATSRAMALKIFDDLGIFPDGRSAIQRRRDEDPIILARLVDPRSTRQNRRFVSFMVAWHLDTRTL